MAQLLSPSSLKSDVTKPGHYVKPAKKPTATPTPQVVVKKAADRPVRKAKAVVESKPIENPRVFDIGPPKSPRQERSSGQILDEQEALLAKMTRYNEYLNQQYLVWEGLPYGSPQYYAVKNQLHAGYARFRRMSAEFDQLSSEFYRAIARSRPIAPPPSHSVPFDPDAITE